MYTTFRQTFVYILYIKSKELCQLNFVYKIYTNVCRNLEHFVYKHFAYKMCTKVCRNVGYILYANILYKFCIHQFWSTKSLHHKHYAYSLYIKFKQNVYTNICMQNVSLISAYFDRFVVDFLVNHCKQLRLETCWLITGGTYQINGLMDYILH